MFFFIPFRNLKYNESYDIPNKIELFPCAIRLSNAYLRLILGFAKTYHALKITNILRTVT